MQKNKLNEHTLTTKPRIAILLGNRQFIRSWFDTGLVQKIENAGFLVTVFAQQDVFMLLPKLSNIQIVNLGTIEPTKKSVHTVALGLVSKRSLSTTFKWKLKMQFLPPQWIFPQNGSFSLRVRAALKSLKRVLGNALDNKMTFVYLVKPCRSILHLYLRLLNEAQDIPLEIKQYSPDWLIMPSSSAQGIVTDCIVGAKSARIQTIVAIDNWDQLTGKSIYPTKPDYFTVMGQRCVEHATYIHDCDPSSVLPFGLPRFDIYRDIQHSCIVRNPANKKKVLYCGVTMAHSEKLIVDSIADFFKETYGPDEIEIHYRPHPGPSQRSDGYEIKNNDVRITKYSNLERTAMPDMNKEFLDALLTADVIVGAPTTLMVEAMLVNRKCVLDLTIDKFHRTTSGLMAKKFTHVLDLTAIQQIPQGATINGLIFEINKLLEDDSNCAHYPIDHLYNTRDRPYADQLISFLQARSSYLE